jgi:hypothetical protein
MPIAVVVGAAWSAGVTRIGKASAATVRAERRRGNFMFAAGSVAAVAKKVMKGRDDRREVSER